MPPGPWEQLISEHRASGRTVERVRRVVEPWTDYTRWELHAFATNEAAGEGVRILPATDVVAPKVQGPDFLITAPYLERWASAVATAIPLTTYLRGTGLRRVS